MKRFLMASSTCILSLIFVGCGHDTRQGLIDDTITMIKLAATEIGNIKTRVKEATDRSRTENKPIDLAEALKAADKLKDTGKEAQKIKSAINIYRSQITDDDRKKNAERTRQDLNEAFKTLLKRKDELRVALAEADELVKSSPTGKAAVEALRERIIEAEGPYEALTR